MVINKIRYLHHLNQSLQFKFLLLFFLFLSSSLGGCGYINKLFSGCANPSQTSIYKELSTTIRSKNFTKGKTFRLKEATSFDWDKFYVFAPYTTPEDIQRSLGFNWSQSNCFGLSSRDDINLLVFVKDGKVVQFLEYPRGDVDFAEFTVSFEPRLSKEKRPDYFSPATAVFYVDKFVDGRLVVKLAKN
jgi:hypothetical protein